jgi:hypothetical protein
MSCCLLKELAEGNSHQNLLERKKICVIDNSFSSTCHRQRMLLDKSYEIHDLTEQ